MVAAAAVSSTAQTTAFVLSPVFGDFFAVVFADVPEVFVLPVFCVPLFCVSVFGVSFFGVSFLSV